MKKVSLIVPIYNVEKYIERCAISIFNQTYENIEYIFVNDCTPDNSMKILEQTIERFPNIKSRTKIINLQQNSGIENTRIVGRENATGDYIQFVDSDDYIEPNMTEQLIVVAERDNADIVVCDYYEEKAKETIIVQHTVATDSFQRVVDLLSNNIPRNVWCRLFKKNIFNFIDVNSPTISYAEDFIIMLQLYFYAKRVSKIDKPLYHYVKENKNSLTIKINEKHFLAVEIFWQRAEAFFEKEGLSSKLSYYIDKQKINWKILLFFASSSIKLKRKYSRRIGLIDYHKFSSQLKIGEKLMLFFDYHKLFFLCELLRFCVVMKKKIF